MLYSFTKKVNSKYLQKANGYTDYSPIWLNASCTELAKLHFGAMWKAYGVTHLKQIFQNGVLRTFTALETEYNLPSSMQFYYIQLQHAVTTQSRSSEWYLSPTPVFSLIRNVDSSRVFISRCYAILLQSYLKQLPLRVREKWERDVGQLDREQWEEVIQVVGTFSLNVSQRLTQLYILLRIYYTPHS